MVHKKYLMRILIRVLSRRTLEQSKNYLIIKSFANNTNSIKKFKTSVMSKSATPLEFDIRKFHFLINLFVASKASEINQYINTLDITNEINNNINIKLFKNTYPIIVKSNNLFFNNFEVYSSFKNLFELYNIFNKTNLLIFLLRYVYKNKKKLNEDDRVGKG